MNNVVTVQNQALLQGSARSLIARVISSATSGLFASRMS